MEICKYVLCVFLFCVRINGEDGNSEEGGTEIIDERDQLPQWHSNVFGTGVGNREALRVGNKTQIVKIKDLPVGVTKWLLLGQESPTLIGIGKSFIAVKQQNERCVKIELEGTVTSAAASLREEWDEVIVASVQEKTSLITAYVVENSSLRAIWNHSLPYNVDSITSWGSHYLVTGDGKLELYQKNSKLCNKGSFQTAGHVSEIAVVQDVGTVFAAVAVPSADQVVIYRVNNAGVHPISHVATIHSKDVHSVTAFRLGMSHYLAVGGEGAGVWRLTDGAVPHRISTNHGSVESWLAITVDTYRHDVILLAQTNSAVSVFEPDGFSDFRYAGNVTKFCQNDCNKMKINLKRAATGLGTILFSNNEDEAILLRLDCYLEEVPDQFQVLNQELDEVKNKYIDLLVDQNEEADDILAQGLPSMDMNATNIITASWMVDTLELESGDFEDHDGDGEFNVNQWYFAGRTDWNTDDLKINLKDLRKSTIDVRSQVLNLKDQLYAALFIEEEPEESSYLDDHVNDGFTVDGNVFVDDLVVETLNGIDTDTWMKDCFRYDHPVPISGTKTTGSVDVFKLQFENLGGVVASDFLYSELGHIDLNGDLILESQITIARDIVLPPEGTVNKMNLQKELFLVDSPFSGPTVLDTVVITGAAQLGQVSHTNDSPPSILPPHFSLDDIDPGSLQQARVDGLVINDQLNVRYINGIDVDKLLKSSDASDFFYGKEQSLSSLSIEYLNGLKFPSAFVQTSDTSPILLDGEKQFASLEVKELKTENLVHFLSLIGDSDSFEDPGIDVRNADEEKLSDAHTNGSWTLVFDDLEVVEPVKAELINNFTWAQLKGFARSREQSLKNRNTDERTMKTQCRSQLFASYDDNSIDDSDPIDFLNMNAEEIEIRGSITTSGTSSGFPTHRFLKYLSKTKSQIIPAALIGQNLTVGNITIWEWGNLEKESTSLSYLGQVGNLNVSGQLNADLVIFNKDVSVDDVVVDGLVNEVDLKALQKDLIYTTDENVFLIGKKNFTDLKVHDVNVYKLNGKRPGTLATRQGDHTFRGPIIFKGRVRVRGDLITLSNFNGVNLTDIGLRVSTTFGAFLIPGDFVLASGATIQNLNFDGLIQQKNFSRFLEDAVFSGNDFEINSDNITFLGDVTIQGDLHIEDKFNDLNLTAFLEDVVLVNRSAKLYQLELMNNTIISHLNVTDHFSVPLVEGCDVNRWREEAVIFDENVFVDGVVKLATIEVHGELGVGMLNDQSTASLIPLKTVQVIPAMLVFREITVNDKMDVHHLVNGRYLPDALKDSLMNNGNQLVTGVKRYVDVDVDGTLDVETVSNRTISDLVTLSTSQNITSVLNFTGGVTLRGDLRTAGSVADVNITNWANRVYFRGSNQVINGSWTVMGNITANSDISGSGLIFDENLVNVSRELDAKFKLVEDVQIQMKENYQAQCERINTYAAALKSQIRVLDMFDDIQGLQFHNSIYSVVDYKLQEEQYLIVSFTGRCSAMLYRWDKSQTKFIRDSRIKIGPVDTWAILPDSEGTLLVTSGPRACERNKSSAAIWKISGSNFLQIARLDSFLDVVPDNVSDSVFHTVFRNGSIVTWELGNGGLHSKIVAELPAGKYKFVSLSLGLGLSVWDGDKLITIDNTGNMAAGSRLPGASVAFSSQGLVALSDGMGLVELYRDIPRNEIIFSGHYSTPTDLYWIDLKSPGELYLVFASEHNKILVFQYKGVSGLKKYASLPYPSSSMSKLELAHGLQSSTPHLLVVNNRVLHLLHARMHGNPDLLLDVSCSNV